ncbi:MAG: hypothetical protein ACRC20_00230 [Segniliparus sp.]|uniref:hypothetical protein n=1 Tax=Segniliparus sp. TaxID=2804064 RepID=UPI003F343AC0
MVREKRRTAGLFDIRVVIAALLAIYGATLVVVDLVDRAEVVAKTGGDADLWVGAGLLAAAGLFAAWALWRPVAVRDSRQPPR